jgi:hypothetical protein
VTKEREPQTLLVIVLLGGADKNSLYRFLVAVDPAADFPELNLELLTNIAEE